MWISLGNGSIVKCTGYNNIAHLASNTESKKKQNQNQLKNQGFPVTKQRAIDIARNFNFLSEIELSKLGKFIQRTHT